MEINRYVEKKFAKRVSWEWVQRLLGQTGTVFKMALILKEKEDSSVKRCIILDMRRSFGNARAKVDEKIVLPRLTDVTAMLQNMWKPRGGAVTRAPASKRAASIAFKTVTTSRRMIYLPVHVQSQPRR